MVSTQEKQKTLADKKLKQAFEDGKRLSSRNLYGKRIGRPLKNSQIDRLENLLPKVAFSKGKLDPKQPLWLEIGFGAGEHLAWQAQQNPNVSCIGVEFFANGVAKALEHMETANLTNLQIHHGDARDVLDVLEEVLAEGSLNLERVFVLHPDPWPKRRHWERRIVQVDFIERLARLMAPKAELRIATDHQDYLTWILSVMQRAPKFTWLADVCSDWQDRRDDWPQTRYEAKGLREGRAATYLRYRLS